MTMRRDSNAGFALPLTIFVLTLVTIMLSAIMVQVQADRRVAESSSDVVSALSVAQSGLERYFSHYDSLTGRPTDGDSLRINVTGGYADVVARVIRKPADTMPGIMYVVRSRGRVIRPTQGADPQAIRTVAQFAEWEYGTMKVIGAYTAINHFTKPCNPPGCDGTFTFIGHDQCAVRPSVPGLRVPQGGTPPLGPPQVDPATLELDNTWAVAAETGINFAGVIGGQFIPDYTSLIDLFSWSSYYRSGNETITNTQGTGLLVVQEDLTLSGSYFKWDGAVLVGGAVHFNADSVQIQGVFISGLEEQTNPSPGTGEWALAPRDIRVLYNSCYVQKAFSAYSGFSPVENGWMDHWSEY